LKPFVALGLGVLLLAGCGPGPRDEVVILAPRDMESQVTAWFEATSMSSFMRAGATRLSRASSTGPSARRPTSS